LMMGWKLKQHLCLQLLLDLPLELVHVIDARGYRSTEHVHLLMEPQKPKWPPDKISSVTALLGTPNATQSAVATSHWHQMDHQKTARIDPKWSRS
jgi:hypothetical protein